MPASARQLADVDKVLAVIATEVKPALTDLRAEEYKPEEPKEDGAIGFFVRATEHSGKRSLVATVRYSAKKQLQIEEIQQS